MDTKATGAVGEGLAFRGFRLLPEARLLLLRGEPVEIGSRAFDLLHVLLQSRGAVVEREEIFRRVWPTTLVEESNLRLQVANLRRALGEDRDLLKTVPGRGYLLAAEVTPPGPAPAPAAEDEAEALRHLLRGVLDELWEMTRAAEVRTRSAQGG